MNISFGCLIFKNLFSKTEIDASGISHNILLPQFKAMNRYCKEILKTNKQTDKQKPQITTK